MAVKIGHASINENGKTTGGKPGDQTGKEVCIRTWYSKPWNVYLVCTDSVIAKKAAEYMEAICKDDDFGYCQSTRSTGYLAIVKANNVVSKAVPSNFDCSSLVASCYKLAGLNINYGCTTKNLKSALLATGKFIAYTDAEHLNSDAYATIGGVYLKEGTHVVMSLENGSKMAPAVSNNTNNISNEKTIWDFFKKKGLNDFAIAGIMGNLYAESHLSPINLQNSTESRLGMTDTSYTNAVDNGTYKNFVRDSAGYGLAQWTYWSRKQNLLDYAKKNSKSIGDLSMQLDFLWEELSKSYKGMFNKLKVAKTVLEASNLMLKEFEKPANQSSTVQKTRCSYSQSYYDKYATKTPVVTEKATTFKVGNTYTLQVELKVRTSAGTQYAAKSYQQLTANAQKNDLDKDGALDKGTRITCQEVKTVGNDIWIKCPSGWIAAYYQNKYYIQ